MNIAVKLLSLDIFIPNEYFENYVALIEKNLTSLKVKNLTQKHHIIPRYYFRHNNLKIDNSKNNLVNLKYTEHILAHYYLALCSKSKVDRISNEAALCRMIGSQGKHLDEIPEINRVLYLELYAQYQKLNSEKHKGKTHITTDETKQKISIANKGKYSTYISLHKGDLEIRVPQELAHTYLSDGYEYGRSERTKKALSDGYNYNSKGMLNKHQTEYQKMQVSKALKGKPKSNQAKSNMSASKQGKKKYINPITHKVNYLDPAYEDDYIAQGYIKYKRYKK